MKKKQRQAISESLSKALETPKRKPSPALNDILSQYAPPPALPEPSPEAIPVTRLNSTQLDSTHISKPQIKALQNPIAPERDFNRRPNSLERDALPKGLFPGTSKKLYDALYLRTRGAVVPVRSIQATRTNVMRWAGIGGLNTFLSHIKHLTQVGLIIRQFEIGNKEGAIYEVQIPEELNLSHSTQLNSTRLNSTQLDSTPNRVHDSTQKLMRVESGNPVENKDSSGAPKTSFKTKEENLDDDAMRRFVETLKQAEREVTGKNASNPAQWNELAEVISAELKIAAARTTVSNVPMFLSEHLRRRLWKLDKKTAQLEGKETPDQVIKGSFAVPNGLMCHDCSNSGWWYPEGPEKGVAKCKHQNLQSVLPK
jgi:hypothetical protein